MTRRAISPLIRGWVLAACALCLSLAGACEGSSPTAPDFGLESFDHAMAKAKGKVVLVNFWATWCGPCIQEMPELNTLRRSIDEESLFMLGLSLDHKPAALKGYLKDHPARYPVYRALPDLVRRYKVNAIPLTLLYDREGNLAHTHKGGESFAKLFMMVQNLLMRA